MLMRPTLEHIADRACVRRHSPSVAVVALLAAIAVGGCETASTTTAGPEPVKCQVSLSTPSPMDAAGGTGSVAVTTQPECAWTASTPMNWISGLSPTSGQGTGQVDFRVAPNEGASSREGDVVVNGMAARVSQRAPCRYAVTPASQNISADGGAGSLSVAANSDCAWTATTDVGWISLTPPVTGSGNGTVSFSVAANGENERTGSVTIAGQRSIVTQAGACSYSISPPSQNIGAAGGAGTAVNVSTQSGCRWTAASNASWLTVTSGASATGNGSVGFTVAANTGASRTGTLTIAGRPFTVTQAAASAPACAYSISSNNQNVVALGGGGTLNVTAGSGCAWTASSNAAWITVTSGATGTGNGSVAFTVAANPSGARTGTLTVAGQTFTVMQAAAAPCNYSISPNNQRVPDTGGTGTVSVTTASGCTWTATSNVAWITITSGSSGTGNGTVMFTVQSSGGTDRNGTLTVAGHTATIEQRK